MIKIVVPISGGKDSQLCLKLALEHYPADEVIGMFCDTQFEHPQTYQHIDFMRELYGVTIHRLNAGDVISKVRHYRRFPTSAVRFCTDELKIQTGKKFYKELAQQQGQGFEVWYGMRWAESDNRAKRYAGMIGEDVYPPHEFMPSKYPKYLAKMGVMIRLPIVELTASAVLAALGSNSHPHYGLGFDRVGCFPCLAAGDRAKEHAFNYDDFGRKQFALVRGVEKEIGKRIFTTKGGTLRNDSGCLFCSY